MTELDIALPRPPREAAARLDFEVADSSCIPHVGWTRFVALALTGAYPHIASLTWNCAVGDLSAVVEGAVTTGRTDTGHSALLRMDVEGIDAWAHVALEHGRVRCGIAAGTYTAIADANAWLRDRLPPAAAEGSRVPVQFWARSSYGAASYARTLEVPTWAEISENYPRPVRVSLGRLLAEPPLADGRLLLWHGVPGTGKTHVVRALGWEWREWCDLHYVTDPEEFFGSAQYMLEVLLGEDEEDDRWRALVLEDTGELLSADAKERTGQGLSRFLNVVDGIVGQGLRVLVLVTTNELLRHLHPAVSRPGRCASALEFGSFAPADAAEWLAKRGAPEIGKAATLAELYAVVGGRDDVPTSSRRVGF